jgi:ribonuclease P protein subunit POP4
VPITGKNILFHELVGLRIRVHGSPCASLLGREGIVVDETANTLLVDEGGRLVRILKAPQHFAITLPSGKTLLVPGRLLMGRPWDRLKNIGKKQYK